MPKGPPWHRKVGSENGAGKTVTAGEFWHGGGRGVGPLRRTGGPHILRVIFKANPFKIELEAGAVCSICDSCLSEARGFELLTGFVSYA